MEIIVQGEGMKSITPNEVVMILNFTTRGATYEEVLDLGSKNVLSFIKNTLFNNNFSKEDMKTRNFVIKEETRYNEETRRHEFDCYSYNQNAIIKFDYDIEKLARFMEDISKLDNPPKCQVNFGIKDEMSCRKEILALAYKDALEKAKAIADASGKILRECAKVDFKPFTTEYISRSSFDSDMMYGKAAAFRETAAMNIVNTFTPEDIELTENLYCLWIAE